MRDLVGAFAVLVLAAGCRDRASPSPGPPVTPVTSVTPAPSPRASTPSALPPRESACSSDDECAVARLVVTGEHACCGACEMTPSTRDWHAKLQRYCAAHPPANCFPLACPQGPTRAICSAGRCEATASGPDGGPLFVDVERRCLPALSCDSWAGCTLATGNTQDGWFVQESERAARGELVGLERVATSDAGQVEAFRLSLPGVKCLPHSVLPVLPPAPSCTQVDGRCKVARGD